MKMIQKGVASTNAFSKIFPIWYMVTVNLGQQNIVKSKLPNIIFFQHYILIHLT